MIEEEEPKFDNTKQILLPEKTKPEWYCRVLEWPVISKIIDIKYWFWGLGIKLHRMWDYAKFGANNLDFDHSYLIDTIEFKLLRMKKEFESSVYHDHTDILKEITHVLDLIHKYKQDNFDFVKEEREKHKKAFGTIEDEWVKLPSGDYQWLMHYRKDGVLHDESSEHSKNAKKASYEIYVLEEKRRKECLKEIMTYIADNMEKWWD